MRQQTILVRMLCVLSIGLRMSSTTKTMSKTTLGFTLYFASINLSESILSRAQNLRGLINFQSWSITDYYYSKICRLDVQNQNTYLLISLFHQKINNVFIGVKMSRGNIIQGVNVTLVDFLKVIFEQILSKEVNPQKWINFLLTQTTMLHKLQRNNLSRTISATIKPNLLSYNNHVD